MSNPTKLFQDDDQEQRTGAASDDELRHITGISPDEEGAMDREAHNGAAEDISAQEQGGFYNPSGDSSASSPVSLKKAEKTAAPNPTEAAAGAATAGEDGLYSGEDGTGGGGAGRRRFRVNRRKAIAGGLVGTVLGGGLFMGGLLSGPFEFAHAAQLLQHNHFATQENAGSRRMGRFYRFLNSSGNAGETRVGSLGSKYANNMISDLKDIGITYDGASTKDGVFTKMIIDTTHKGSPYYGMNEDEVKGALYDRGLNVDKMNINSSGGIIEVEPDGFLGKLNVTKFMGTFLNKGKLSTLMSVRSFRKFSLVDWHPMSQVEGKYEKKLAALWETAKDKFTADGQPSIEETMAADSPKVENNEPASVQEPKGGESSVGEDTIHGDEGAARSGLTGLLRKISGGVGAAQVAVCTTNKIAKDLPKLRYVKDILPMIRLATVTVTLGNAVMNGGDVSPAELSQASHVFFDASAAAGGTSWLSAQTFQADGGATTLDGADMNSGTKSILKNAQPSSVSWALSTAVTDSCSGIGALLIGAAGLLVNINPETSVINNILNAAAGIAIGVGIGYAADSLGDYIAHQILGETVNVLAGGAQWGNYVNYGARYFSNDGAVGVGGAELQPADAKVVNDQVDVAYNQEFQSQSFAARLFNPYDARSLVSHIIDTQNTDAVQNIASAFSKIGSIFSSVLKMPATIFSSVVHATPSQANTYQYPFPQFGFTDAELSNPAFANPYDNAAEVAKILDTPCFDQEGDSNHPCGQDFIAQAYNCFGATIQKDSNGNWDVLTSTTSSDEANYRQYDLYDPANYDTANCADSSAVRKLGRGTATEQDYTVDECDIGTSDSDSDACSHADLTTVPHYNPYGAKFGPSPGDPKGTLPWLRVRMFIFDTTTMKSYACYNGDTQSCDDLQFSGSGSSSSAGSGSNSGSSGGPTTPGTYKNPLRAIGGLIPERIDGGVDYNGGDGPIYSVGDGKVIGVRTGSSSGWPGNPGAYIMYQLTDGPAQGKYVYVAEDCTPTVKEGDTLTADTPVCNYHYTGTAMELGWSDGSYNYVTNDYPSHGGGFYASNGGQDFSKFMVSIGGAPGIIEGTKSTVPMPSGWPTW